MLVLNRGPSPRYLADFARQPPCFEFSGLPASDQSSRFMRTHLPFGQPHYKDAKYIHLARNPYNVCVSFFHLIKQFPLFRFGDGKFGDFVEAFRRGKVGTLHHLDHVLSGYGFRDKPNVLFLTYENLKAHKAGTVLKLAKFFGDPYASMFDQDNELMDAILHESSVDYMKKTYEVNNEEFRTIYNHPPLSPEVEAEVRNTRSGTTRFNIVRQGTAGDGQAHFSPELLQQTQAWTDEKTRDSDVMDIWGNVLA
ncbi:unnamed protein product, partial [Ixodes hexagonus]